MPASIRFLLGKVYATPGAVEALAHNEEDLIVYLDRHIRADWGDLCSEDKAANNQALIDGTRLLSAYQLKDKTTIWLITEWDRSATTALLPSEY